MAIICRPSGLLFIMTPRTGCTALGELLCGQLQGEYLPETDVLQPNGLYAVPKKHTTLRQLLDEGLLTPEERSRLFVFAAVRNPFDSLVSLYTKKSKTYQPLLADPDAWVHRVRGYVDDMQFCQNHSFEQWIVRHYQSRGIKSWFWPKRKSLFGKYVDGIDAVLRFEHLQEDFDDVLKRKNVSAPLSIPRLNGTPERTVNYRNYYTKQARKLVERVFGEELARYGYSF